MSIGSCSLRRPSSTRWLEFPGRSKEQVQKRKQGVGRACSSMAIPSGQHNSLSTPAFPGNHLIERLAPVWFWGVRPLVAGERIAKGDRDIKVEILGNAQDGLGLLWFPHRSDA